MYQFHNSLYYSWKKTSHNREHVVEWHDIQSLRMKYLRTSKVYRQEGRVVVCADETCTHISHTAPMTGMISGVQEWRLLFQTISGGQCVILHAGST